MFVHKVRELDVLQLQSVRIEVVAAPLGVHVHGDPVSPPPQSIGVVCVAHDRGRERVDDTRQTVFDTTSHGGTHISGSRDSRYDISSVCIVVVISGRR